MIDEASQLLQHCHRILLLRCDYVPMFCVKGLSCICISAFLISELHYLLNASLALTLQCSKVSAAVLMVHIHACPFKCCRMLLIDST